MGDKIANETITEKILCCSRGNLCNLVVIFRNDYKWFLSLLGFSDVSACFAYSAVKRIYLHEVIQQLPEGFTPM